MKIRYLLRMIPWSILIWSIKYLSTFYKSNKLITTLLAAIAIGIYLGVSFLFFRTSKGMKEKQVIKGHGISLAISELINVAIIYSQKMNMSETAKEIVAWEYAGGGISSYVSILFIAIMFFVFDYIFVNSIE